MTINEKTSVSIGVLVVIIGAVAQFFLYSGRVDAFTNRLSTVEITEKDHTAHVIAIYQLLYEIKGELFQLGREKENVRRK